MRQCHPLPLFLALCVPMILPACSKAPPAPDQAAQNVATNTAAPAKTVSTDASAPGPGAHAIESKTDGLEFSYKWPAEAAAIPELNSWLRGNADKMRAGSRHDSMADQAAAKKDGYPFHDHSYEESFAVVADTPRMLALLSDGYVYTGGAHGMPINTAILWDKTVKKRLATAALLDVPRLTTIAKPRFCKALDAQRAEKRGAPVTQDDTDMLDDFVRCVDMTKQLILPVSKGGKALDTVRVVIGPYEAGPFAEGSYVIDMPMDASLLAAVKPDWRDAFAEGK